MKQLHKSVLAYESAQDDCVQAYISFSALACLPTSN